MLLKSKSESFADIFFDLYSLGQNVQDVMTRDPVTVTTNDLMKVAAETM